MQPKTQTSQLFSNRGASMGSQLPLCTGLRGHLHHPPSLEFGSFEAWCYLYPSLLSTCVINRTTPCTPTKTHSSYAATQFNNYLFVKLHILSHSIILYTCFLFLFFFKLTLKYYHFYITSFHFLYHFIYFYYYYLNKKFYFSIPLFHFSISIIIFIFKFFFKYERCDGSWCCFAKHPQINILRGRTQQAP